MLYLVPGLYKLLARNTSSPDVVARKIKALEDRLHIGER